MLAMMIGSQGQPGPSLESDLSFVASQAAIELDNHLLGRGGQFVAVGQLADYLRASTETGAGVARTMSLLDPQAVEVVSRAIDASGEQTIKTLEDLQSHAGRLATELGNMKGDGDGSKIERLRDFCVSLSQVATAHQQAMLDLESTHPDRS